MIASIVIPKLRPLLSMGAALGLAGLLAACGGRSNTPPISAPTPVPPVTDPAPAPPVPANAVTYDVIPLNPRGETYGAVLRHGINDKGMVAGFNIYPEPVGSRAFLYDGQKLVELGTFGGEYSRANGINHCGQVTGWADGADGIHHAFLYDGTLHDLGTLGGPTAEGNAINNCGTIVGISSLPGLAGALRGFVYDGTMHDIGTFPGGRSSFATDINAHGVVVGWADGPDGASHAFIYDSKAGSGLQDLGTLGGSGSSADIINDAGQVAGTSVTATGARHAFRYSGGVMQDLGPFDGTGTSSPADMNAAGLVIGFSYSDETPTHGFFFDGKTVTDLGLYTVPVAISASGQVVGSYSAPALHAMSWTLEGGLVDLNTRLHEPPAGLVLLNALAISDNGSIVALSNTGLVLLKVRN